MELPGIKSGMQKGGKVGISAENFCSGKKRRLGNTIGDGFFHQRIDIRHLRPHRI